MSKKPKMVLCRNCNSPIAKKAKICPVCGIKNKKPFFRRGWFVFLVVILVLGGIGSINRSIKEKFDWNEVELCDRLPKPKSNVEMGTLNWPKSEVAGLLPLPKSTVGKVSTDTENGCFIYVGETSINDFNKYADECSDKGFHVDYERGDKFYDANDVAGNELSLSYQGNNVMIIKIRKAEEKAPETEQQTEPAEKSSDSAELIDGMRPDFKQAMDSYEEFMNEYCEFMKKYAESDGTDVGLLADYAKYMSKYMDVVDDFEVWDDGEMNTAEMSYYLDVQTRINQKLLEVAE